MTLRLLLGCLLGLVLAAPALRASDLTIVRIQPGWRDAASFKRISEYFTGREHTGREVVLRTHPGTRAGYYFLIRVRNTGAPVRATFAFQVIPNSRAQPVLHQLTAELGTGDTLLNLGLTGPDWPEADTNPVAWKLEVKGEDGHVLATALSYLWEKPSAP
ncbi:MAG: hypothetical protein JNG83_02505 [Opitutaceae bacterium]|nr:hypothetical protein [Opitutaceae bacterium]